MVYIPLIGAFFEATSAILHKKVLRKDKINYKNFVVYAFLTVVLIMIPLVFFVWEIKAEALEPKNILIFFIIVIISILANLFAFYALKRKDITELEPIRLMQPLFVILIVFILSFFFSIYADERNYSILGLALIASVALVFPHIKKNHFYFNKYLIAGVIGSFLFALEMVISRTILPYYSILTYYFLRCLFIFLITAFIFRPKITSIENKTKFMIFLIGIFAVLYRFTVYYGYLNLGIVFTTTVFLLAPVLIYIFAAIFLKEKIHIKHIISSAIIIACVAGAIFVGG